MRDFYTTSRISEINFGTIDGELRGVNSTTVGDSVSVLRREADACLKTYLADGVTLDNSTYPDDCNYDPRYTSWYPYAKSAGSGSSGSDADRNTCSHPSNHC